MANPNPSHEPHVTASMRKTGNGFWKSLNAHADPARHTAFPIAEGLGIFVGVVGWDLLSEGHLELVKAALIAAPATLVWYALRWWYERRNDNNHGNH